jgi:hypothetical protein
MELFCNNFEVLFFFCNVKNSGRGKCGYGMVGGCFTNVVLHSLKNYHQEHATEPGRLPMDIAAGWDDVMLRFRSFQFVQK